MDMSTSDDSPFNKVPLEIAFNIIEHLNLETRKNLALTCRKWYEILLALPESKKCIVDEPKLKWTYNALYRDRGYGLIEVHIYPDDPSICTHRTKFNLVQKLKIRKIKLCHREMTDCTIDDFFRFLKENNTRIEITKMLIRSQLNEEQFQLLDAVADIPESIFMETDFDNYWSPEEQLYRGQVDTIIKSHLSYKNIKTRKISEMETIATILQQWVRGERPKLHHLECELPIMITNYDRETVVGMTSIIVSRLKDYIGQVIVEGTEEEPEIKFTVTAPGIGVMNAEILAAYFTMYSEKKK